MLSAISQFSLAQSDTNSRDLRETLESLLPALSAAEITQLIDTGELSATSRGEPTTRMAPAYRSVLQEQLESLNPDIGVEVLFLVPSPLKDNLITVGAYATLQAMSTMEGIEYYSASRGHMRTLFYQSYVIDDPDDRNRLPDPTPRHVPAQETLYVFQEDSTFGKNVLKLVFRSNTEAVLVSMQNLTRMLYAGFIPAVGPKELQLHLVVRPVGDYLLFYGNTGADPLSLFGIAKRVQTSFYNRLVALYNWYLSELHLRSE